MIHSDDEFYNPSESSTGFVESSTRFFEMKMLQSTIVDLLVVLVLLFLKLRFPFNLPITRGGPRGRPPQAIGIHHSKCSS